MERIHPAGKIWPMFIGMALVCLALGCRPGEQTASGPSPIPIENKSAAGDTGDTAPGLQQDESPVPQQDESPPPQRDEPEAERQYETRRKQMVERQLRGRDITDPRVLATMQRIPRHRFVPEPIRDLAYSDQALPIGHDQTISQPYVVALMTQLAEPDPSDRALDIGTGSGYQAAVLGELVSRVYSIEILEPLADEARDRLQELRYKNIVVRHGDGYQGWPEHAPFDVIIVAAAPGHIPQPLIDQLAPEGRLVIPVGKFWQDLIVVSKDADGQIHQRKVAPVAFVPMTGEAQDKDK